MPTSHEPRDHSDDRDLLRRVLRQNLPLGPHEFPDDWADGSVADLLIRDVEQKEDGLKATDVAPEDADVPSDHHSF